MNARGCFCEEDHEPYPAAGCGDGVYLADHYHGHPIWKAYRAGLDALVAELDPVVDSPAAEEFIPDK